MDIDIERLKTDPGYWDECGAPEWATTFGLVGVRKLPVWFNLQEYQHASCGHSNRAFDFSNDSTYSFYQISGEIPRPTKPAAPEWDGEGYPPVGCECEVKDTTGEWHECLVVGYNKSCAVFYCDNWTVDSDYDAFPASEFRPIRTKEQRQRDELAVEIWSLDGRSKDHAYSVADHILSRYNLEPKDA